MEKPQPPKLKLSKETVRKLVFASPNGQDYDTFSGTCGGYTGPLSCACSTGTCQTYAPTTCKGCKI